jgi:hypothetical protein
VLPLYLHVTLTPTYREPPEITQELQYVGESRDQDLDQDRAVVMIKAKIALSLLIRSEDNCRAYALRDSLANTRAVVLRREGGGFRIEKEFEAEKQLRACEMTRAMPIAVQT